MKYFSMFSAIGGMELGIKKATNGSWECVGFSEINKYAISIYEKHFKHKEYGDARNIKWSDVEDFDLLCCGFPCPSFSIAGRRGGFNDKRGLLFFEITRCLRKKRPSLVLLENVKGILSHAQGKTFTVILAALDELGYDCQWQIINSANFGTPQNRERLFLVGHLRGTPRPEVFPLKGSGSKNLKEITQKVSDAQRIYDSRGIAKSLKALGGGLGAKTGLYMMKDLRIRRLTPTEAERLQGFPDGFTEGLSDSQRYRVLGNAVTVNVVKAIMEKLK